MAPIWDLAYLEPMLGYDSIQDHEFFFAETREGPLIPCECGPGTLLGLLLFQRIIQGFRDHGAELDAPCLSGTLCGGLERRLAGR